MMSVSPPLPAPPLTVPAPVPSLRHNKAFMLLWWAQIASQLADRIIFVVFVALIAQNYGNNESYTSYLYVAFTIPAIALTAVAGVFADRWPRRTTLVVTNLARAALMALVPWGVSHGLTSLYAMAFLLSTATQFFVPAEAATIPTLVKQEQLVKANSMFTTTMMASVIVGFALGDPLINLMSLAHVHWGILGLFLLAAWLASRIQAPQLDEPAHVSTSSAQGLGTVWHDMGEGLAYLRQTPRVYKPIALLALLFSTVVALSIVAIGLAKQVLYVDATLAASKFSYLIAVSGLGMALGAYLTAKPLHHWPAERFVPLGLGLMGFALVAMALVAVAIPNLAAPLIATGAFNVAGITVAAFELTQRMAYTYAGAGLFGIGVCMVAVPLQAQIHTELPTDKRGKVLGVQFTALSTASTLPALLAGWGSEHWGVLPMLLVMGLPLLGLALLGVFRPNALLCKG
jgi:MFS family permease